MSIIATNHFLDTLKDKLKDEIPYSYMELVMTRAKELLFNYEMTQVVIEDNGEDTLLNAYLSARRVEGLSEKTIERYRYELERFLKYEKVTTINITQYHIRDYLAMMRERVQDSTVKATCWVISSYFTWLHKDGIIQRNPIGNIGRMKVQKKQKEVFSDVELERLKEHCKTIRDRAIVSFLKSTGCRISEMCRLNRDDIDFVNLECIVLGKGNKQRPIYMDAVTGMYLKQYLSERVDDNPALFFSRKKRRFTPGGCQCMLRKLGKSAEVNHVHPHKFRRTELTELVKRGMPIEQVKMIAGHDKIDTTMTYVTLDQQCVKNSYRKYA